LDRIRTAGKEDDTWTARKGELRQLKQRGETLPKNCQWEVEDGLLYYQNTLFIPWNQEVLTEIGKGYHDSKVARQVRQKKSIERVTRNLHWEKLAE